MSRRSAQLTESVQQLGDITIADAFGFGNVQVIKPGVQKLDPNVDLVLMTLGVPATLLLPSLADVVLSYAYKIHHVGTVPLTVTTLSGETLDRRTLITSASLPPTANVTFAAIQQDDGTREWAVTDFTFVTQSFPRMVTGAVFDTATVELPLGLITTIGSSVTLVNLPIDPPTGSSIGIRSDSGITLNPTIDAGTGRLVQSLGGNLDYNQTNPLGLKKRESFVYAYCADVLSWSAIARPSSP